jgi:hypothetical protein
MPAEATLNGVVRKLDVGFRRTHTSTKHPRDYAAEVGVATLGMQPDPVRGPD